LANKPADVYTVQKDTKVSEVIELMKAEGISQLPVIDRGHLVGLVNESALLQMLIDDGMESLNYPVSKVASDAYEVADPDAPLGLFNHIFGQGKVVVVWERGEVRGLITKIDVIDFLAHRRQL
jgi:cystathionine beta-synthase